MLLRVHGHARHGGQRMDVYEFREGSTPLLISMPHVGTHIPDALAARMTDTARAVPDTDWHVDRLYEFAKAMGAGMLRANLSRYVIDLNRAPDGASLYPGASVTELCPTTSFNNEALYRDGEAPDEAEIAERRERYWQPYHDKLSATLGELRSTHGIALLFDAHSIASVVPRFFDGRLADLNLGTADGASCAATLASTMAATLASAAPYTCVVNGRFKGGYITRSQGRPDEGVHAAQLELSQATYMEEAPPYRYHEELARQLQPHLRALLRAMLDWAATAANA